MPQVSTFSTIFPPAPKFTDKHLPSLAGRVFVVTGAASGVGFELAKILYLAGGIVHIAARSEARCQGAMEKLLALPRNTPESRQGVLRSMVIDLGDLRSVRSCGEAFAKRESRLDVLFHNAAVMEPPAGSKDVLGHDLELGTNTLGPYLLTLLLEPLLVTTAALPGMSPGSVRIVWVVSILQQGPPDPMQFEADGTPKIREGFMVNYLQSKNGATWLADKFAKRLDSKGILSVALHPGLMRTELQRNYPFPLALGMKIAFKGPVYGAYSELFSGLSPDVRMEHNGGYQMAWGRHCDYPENLVKALKTKSEGGTGVAAKFYDYCDREVVAYM